MVWTIAVYYNKKTGTAWFCRSRAYMLNFGFLFSLEEKAENENKQVENTGANEHVSGYGPGSFNSCERIQENDDTECDRQNSGNQP